MHELLSQELGKNYSKKKVGPSSPPSTKFELHATQYAWKNHKKFMQRTHIKITCQKNYSKNLKLGQALPMHWVWAMCKLVCLTKTKKFMQQTPIITTHQKNYSKSKVGSSSTHPPSLNLCSLAYPKEKQKIKESRANSNNNNLPKKIIHKI